MQIESSGRFFKNTQISKFMKIRPVEATCSMRSGRKTDTTMLIRAFRNFANAPEKTDFK